MKCPECKGPATKNQWTRRVYRCSDPNCNHVFFTPRRYQKPKNFRYVHVDRAGIEDTNDCMVKATHIAMGISYPDAHALFSLAGRDNRKGTYFWTATKAFQFAKELSMVASIQAVDPDTIVPRESRRRTDEEMDSMRRSYGRYKPVTLAQIREHVKTGYYIVCNRNHAWAIIDGVSHDGAYRNGRTEIQYLYKVERIQ